MGRKSLSILLILLIVIQVLPPIPIMVSAALPPPPSENLLRYAKEYYEALAAQQGVEPYRAYLETVEGNEPYSTRTRASTDASGIQRMYAAIDGIVSDHNNRWAYYSDAEIGIKYASYNMAAERRFNVIRCQYIYRQSSSGPVTPYPPSFTLQATNSPPSLWNTELVDMPPIHAVSVENIGDPIDIGSGRQAMWCEAKFDTDLSGQYVRIGISPYERNGVLSNPLIYELELYFDESIAPRPPVVTLISPAQNSDVIPGSEVDITVSATDEDSEVEHVEFYINDILYEGPITRQDSYYTITLSNLPEGEYRLNVIAYNGKGKKNEPLNVSFYVGYPNEIKTRIAAAETAEDLAMILGEIKYKNSFSIFYNLKTDLFINLDLTSKITLAQLLLGKTFPYSSEDINMFNNLLILTAINNASGVDALEVVLENSMEYILDSEMYNEFITFPSSDKHVFINFLFNERNKKETKSFESLTEILEIYNIARVLMVIKNGSVSDVGNVLLNNAQLLNLNISGKFADFSQSQKAQVYEQLTGKIFSSLSEVANAFDAAVENVYKRSSNNSLPSKKNSGSLSNKSGGKDSGVSYFHGNLTSLPVLKAVPQDILNALELENDNDASSTLSKGEAGEFSDLEQAPEAKDAIIYLANKQIVSGFGDGTFRPMESLTREQFVKIIVEAFGFEFTAENPDFTDVRETEWYTPYIAAAVKARIIFGMGDGTFGIGLPVSRQDMCAITYRAALVKNIVIEPYDSGHILEDEHDISEYAIEAVYTFLENGYVNVVRQNVFEPKRDATRAQMAILIYNILERKIYDTKKISGEVEEKESLQVIYGENESNDMMDDNDANLGNDEEGDEEVQEQ